MSNVKTAPLSSIMNLVNNDSKGSDLKNKDLQIECILRGMAFEDVLRSSFIRLANWLVEHATLPKDFELLEKYDNYIEDILREKGKEELIHNSLRLGYVQRDEEEGEEKQKKEKVVKEKKAPKEKDTNGFYKGTKKSYTYECQGRGKTLEQTIIKVKRKFPEAQDKSIRIWYNKAKKSNNEKP